MKSKLFLFKNFIFRHQAVRLFSKLVSNDNLNHGELDQHNWNSRMQIVRYSYENIPFYRELYDQTGFHPDQLKGPEDWDLVPSIDKVQIRDSFDKIVNTAIDKKRHIVSSTGGTSGKPLKVLHDKCDFNDVNGWRVMKWWGLPVSPDIAFVFRLRRSSKMSVLLNKLIWFPTRRYFLDATNVDDAKIKSFLDEIRTGHVQVLQGYTGALNEVAKYAIQNNIEIKGIRAVWCTSSPLTNQIRVNLQTAFNADVYDQYGSGEVYWIATECDHHQGLHIHSDIRHVDILDENGVGVKNGIVGNVAITDLQNYLFPIIKYRNGDLSVIKDIKCTCGKPYPLLEKIYGRISDLIRLPNGGFIAGDYFTTIFDDYADDIDAFQIHQKRDFSVDINVKLSNNNKYDFLDRIFSVIQEKTGNDIILRVNRVDEVDNNLGGKNRFVISDIK